MTKVNSITRDEIEALLRDVDWTSVHHERIGRSGQRVEFWINDECTKIETCVMEQGTWQPGVNHLGSLRVLDLGAIDTEWYSSGWTTCDRDSGQYTETETGKVMDEEDMVHQCIDEGDHDYEPWIDELLEQFNRDGICTR